LSETVEEEIPKSVPSPVPAKRPPERVERPRQEHFQHGDRDKRGKRFDQRRGKPTPQPAPEPPKPKVRTYNLPELIQIPDFISLKELTEKLNIKLKDIEERMKGSNKEYVTNQILDVEEVKAICAEFKVEVDIIPFEDAVFYGHIEKSKAQLTPRAPVVTVMGHVDHGKTTLLDTLRHTRVAEREAGGITQKIGAYKLTYNNTDIIFLDTPGHEAFTNIRARGAKVTDIVILIVAANDGVKPQTIEAINHAKAAGVPIIVAINKIDLPGADPTKVKQELSRYGIVVEDWGGDVVSVEISAKLNKNLDALLEMVILVSEMLEIKAYKNISARGTIIESRLDPKLGPLGTVLLQHGTVNRGDFFICGESVGKIKSIFDDQGKVLNSAEVPLPIEIMGFENVPEAGERFQVVDDVEKVRKVIDMRKLREKEARKEESISDKKLSLQNLFDRLEENKTKVFPLIIKADNFSSAEVLENILLKQSQEGLKINIMHKGIGNITEGDILLASTSGSIILGFNVKAPQKILGLAKREQIEIKLYNVIYHLIEDIARAIKGEMAPEYIETKIGSVEVLQVFKISKLGNIAGCLVKEGKVTNKSKLKVFRDNDFVFEGEVETLRRIKNEASEVNAGTECGIRIKNFNGIEIGDTLEAYEVKIKE
jgi:translation initiation factor IF-2